jgi:hypothetical protein
MMNAKVQSFGETAKTWRKKLPWQGWEKKRKGWRDNEGGGMTE